MIFTIKTFKNLDEFNNHLIKNSMDWILKSYTTKVLKLFYKDYDFDTMEDLIELRMYNPNFTTIYADYNKYYKLLDTIKGYYLQYQSQLKSKY